MRRFMALWFSAIKKDRQKSATTKGKQQNPLSDLFNVNFFLKQIFCTFCTKMTR